MAHLLPLALPDEAAARDAGRKDGVGCPTDEALMERFCQGQASAFDQLFARYQVPLHGYLSQMTRSRTAADDLLQVTFLHLVKARGRYARGEKVAPWLYAIARNAARDYLRLAKHRFETQADGRVLEALPRSEPPEVDASEVKAVRAALDALPLPQREAVLLHQIQGLSFGEIAAILGTTSGAAKVRAHRGYQWLRAALAGLRKGTAE